VNEALTFLGPALVMCLIIASIHVYLGMHILEREIIFVDLSLAQLAALGALATAFLGYAEGHAEEGIVPHLGAFGFTILGAAIFTVTGRARRYVSQEAVVGIVYAVASALMILVLSRAPHGAERIKDTLVGALLVTTWEQVGKAAAVYAVLGIVHVFFARQFIRISWARDEAEKTMSRVGWWDFGFYVLFGVVITISVQIAGVLLVFSYLIVPAVITKLFSKRMLVRLFTGWIVALAASIAGLWASWTWDFPTGATVVAAFGVLLLLAACVRLLRGVG
jgi:zinc/manganese transport system permease protein